MDQMIREVDTHSYHRHSSHKLMRNILCTILTFLLSLCVVGLTVLIVIKFSCFSKSSFYQNMTSNDYYNSVQSLIYENAEALTLPTGLPVEVLEEAIDIYSVHKDVNGYLDAAYTGDKYKTDTSTISFKLDQNIRDYFEKEQITPTEEQEHNIASYIESITDEYTKSVQMPLLNYFIQVKNIFNKIFIIGLITFLLIIAIISFSIIKMHHWLHRGIRYLVYGTLSSALMVTIFPAVILTSGFYKKVNLSPQYFYNFAMSYITNLFQSLIYSGISLGILSVILIIVIHILKDNLLGRK